MRPPEDPAADSLRGARLVDQSHHVMLEIELRRSKRNHTALEAAAAQVIDHEIAYGLALRVDQEPFEPANRLAFGIAHEGAGHRDRAIEALEESLELARRVADPSHVV